MDRNSILENEIEIKFKNTCPINNNVDTTNNKCLSLNNILYYLTKYKNKKINPTEIIDNQIKIINLKKDKNILIIKIDKISNQIILLDKKIEKYNNNILFVNTNTNLYLLLNNKYKSNIKIKKECIKRIDELNLLLDELDLTINY